MIIKILTSLFIAALLIIAIGCERDVDLLEPAAYPTFGEVFLDEFVAGLDYSAFGTSKLDAFEIDEDVTYDGSAASIKITVPGVGDPTGGTDGYAGGVLYSKFARDLSGYNALTFWGKASSVATVALIGFGVDNITTPLYAVQQNDVVFGTSWQKYIIPIPLASKLATETGMFQYAAGADANDYGFELWFDEIKFENLKTVKYPFISVNNTTIDAFVGQTLNIVGDLEAGFDVNGTIQKVSAMPSYYTLISSNDTIVSVSEDNIVTAVGGGIATIAVKIGDLEAKDTITVVVDVLDLAPTPTFAESDVISLFCNAYTDFSGINWNTKWTYTTTQTEDFTIGDNDIKYYTDLNWVGIVFETSTLDASSMTNFHMDIYTSDPINYPADYKIKLVDFGADGIEGGGDDSDHELTFTASTNPALAFETWVTLDIPLSQFTTLTNKGHIGQLVLSSGSSGINNFYIDNVLFHK